MRQDLPISHPDFGKIKVCVCRQQEVRQKTQERLYHLSNLEAFRDMTFDSFKTQGHIALTARQVQSLKAAHHAARHLAEHLDGWLLLMGAYGCGKTHLAAAVANFVLDLAVPTIFLTVPDLLDWLRFSYGSQETSFETRFNEIRDVRLLVLDDLGTQNATPWASEKLYQIINYRYVNRLATIITTNAELEDIDGRVSSRLQDPELVTVIKIMAPDYRAPGKDTGHPQLSSLHLHTKRTFGNFSMRENEKLPPEQQKTMDKTFRAAQHFAEKPAGWLVLMGTYSTGKTHLAAAIGNYRHAEGDEPMFVVVPDLLDHLRATFSPNSSVSYDRMFQEVRTSPLLILDDLGTQSATPWAREKLYQLLNYRYNAELPTVITTSSPLEEIDTRINSRMLDATLCHIHYIDVPPYRPGSPAKNRARRTK